MEKKLTSQHASVRNGENQQISVRSLALDIVMQTLEEGKYCDKVLHQALDGASRLTKQERAFLTRLSEGTIERCIELDYVLNQFSSVKVSKMKPVIRNILRMGVYQLLYMEQVPDRAACDEAVKLAVKRKFQGLRGFVNGVLRSVQRQRETISYPDKTDFVSYASIRYSMPEWIVKRFLEDYSEELTEEILQGFLEEDRGTTVRCNLYLGNDRTEKEPGDLRNTTGEIKQRVDRIRDSLEGQQVKVREGRLFPYALRISGYDRLTSLKEFREGRIQVQDESSMVVGAVSGISQGQTVLDVCAAPGGKALHAADLLQGTGIILACDLSEGKVRLIQENMERLGVENSELYQQDARILRKDWIGTVDVLIADLPCSGLGVIGKKCDIKYKTKPEDIKSLACLQRKILQVVSQYVRPGGTLIYSTCTIAREENEENMAWICDELPFTPVSVEEMLPTSLRGRTGEKGYIQILPADGADGFFAARFQKKIQDDNSWTAE